MSDSDGSYSDSKRKRNENHGSFKKSEKVIRTPPNQEKGEKQEIMGLCKEMLEEIKKVRMEQTEMKEKLEDNNKEMRQLREQIAQLDEMWEHKYKKLEGKLKQMENRIETVENEARKNNLIVTGLEIPGENREQKEYIQNWIKKEIGVEERVKELAKITEKRFIIKMENFEGKLNILKNKNKIKNRNVYIDSDMAPHERMIQRNLRIKAKKMREDGNTVKVAHLKLIVDGRVMTWNEDENRLVERKKQAYKSKN